MASEQRRFAVEGIHCDACERRIRTALEQLPGVRSVKADHTTQQVEVRLERTRIALEQVEERLEALGYPVKNS